MNLQNLKKFQFPVLTLIAANLALVAVTGCAKNSTGGTSVEDTSSSGSVASAIGGANNGSTTSGTMSMIEPKRNANFDIEKFLAKIDPLSNAYASTTCTTLTTGELASCVTNGSATITYSDCSFGASTATWNGSVVFTCSSATHINRAITNGTTRTNSFGSVVTVNTSGLTAFNGTTLTGGGTTLDTSANTIAIGGVQLIGTNAGRTIYNFMVTSSALTRAVSSSGTVVNGQVTTYHNLAKVVGTATVSDLTFVSGCCTPTSGSISTVFQTSGGYAALSGFNGATETLQFTGCGTANYTGPEGVSGSVTLANCI